MEASAAAPYTPKSLFTGRLIRLYHCLIDRICFTYKKYAYKFEVCALLKRLVINSKRGGLMELLQVFYILFWRCSKLAAVFTTELRWTFIPNQ